VRPVSPHAGNLRVLMATCEWPTSERPQDVPFIVRQVEFLRRAGVDIDVFFFRGAKKLANYLRAWKQFHYKRAHGQYDLVHAQWGQSGLLALPKLLPLVVTFRGDDLEGIVGPNGHYTLAGRFLQLGSQMVAYAADEVITVSEKLARDLPRRPFHIIPSGLDLDLFRPMPVIDARRQLGLPQDKRLILFAANPENARKRYWLALAAVELLGAAPPTEIVVAKGVPHNKMPLYMNACDVLLLTSLHEGSPNVVKEALACNLPVVSTDVGDVSARVERIEGCAVVHDSPDEVASALRMALSRANRIESRKMVITLDEGELTRQIIQVYQKALTRKRL
jgi:teichuronic acid biosynthesis glycosyltransferase TuaC